MPFPAPTVTPPAGLADFEFSFNNYTFGGINPAGPVGIIKADGLDVPPLRTGDPSRPRDHGAFVGLNLLGPRTISLDLLIAGTAPGFRFSTAKAALVAALAPSPDTEAPLYVKMPDLSLLVCMARAIRTSFSVDINRIAPATAGQQGGLPCSVQFTATDPRFYETPTHNTTVAVGGSQTLTHLGDIEMRPVLVITGACTNPSVSNSSIPGTPTLTFTGVVAAGDTLTVDLDFHSVIYFNHTSGVSSIAANWITTASTWWNLVPGTNTIHFASGGGGSLAVQWASAYETAA